MLRIGERLLHFAQAAILAAECDILPLQVCGLMLRIGERLLHFAQAANLVAECGVLLLQVYDMMLCIGERQLRLWKRLVGRRCPCSPGIARLVENRIQLIRKAMQFQMTRNHHFERACDNAAA